MSAGFKTGEVYTSRYRWARIPDDLFKITLDWTWPDHQFYGAIQIIDPDSGAVLQSSVFYNLLRVYPSKVLTAGGVSMIYTRQFDNNQIPDATIVLVKNQHFGSTVDASLNGFLRIVIRNDYHRPLAYTWSYSVNNGVRP